MFRDSPQGAGNNTEATEAIGGYSISHGHVDRAFPNDFDTFANPRTVHHQHTPSMASIESVFNQPGSPPVYNLNKPLAANSSTDKVPSPRRESDDHHEQAPTWSELKTKAGKERKRLPLACIACRRKKIKCSGEKPACKHCLKARIPCVYKVTTRKAAPRTDYMAMLDKRLKRMEDRVIKIIPKDELPETTTRSVLRPPLPGTTPKSEKDEANAKRTAEEAFTNELQAWAKGRTGAIPLDGAARTRPPRDVENTLYTEGNEALPPEHIQEHLVEVYFDCVYGQSYLLLHKPSFMRKLKAGTVPPVLILSICGISARFSTHPQVSTEPAFLRGEKWATPARNICEKRHAEPNITILTCMIMLGLHYFGTCEGGLSWSFGGQAMRMAYALQLHKELDHDPSGLAQAERAAASGKPVPPIQELSFTDREIRRRVMWSCYLMDTFNSSGTERPSFLNEEYMFIQLPIKEVHFQMELPGRTEDLEGHVPITSTRKPADDTQVEARANMGVAAYVVRAVVLWKRVVKYLNLGGREKDSHQMWDPLSQFANLQRQVTQLKASLPSSLVYNSDNLASHATERLANQFIFLHLVIAQNNLFLHRFAIPTAPNTRRSYPSNAPKSFVAAAATTAVDAASRISKLIADSTGHTLTVPFAGYCAYASATIHIWGIFSKNTTLEQASRENLRHCYKYLNRMKRYWGMFHYMAESVKDAYRAFSDASARAAKKQSRGQETQNGQTDPFENLDRSSKNADGSTDGQEIEEPRNEGKSVEVLQYGDWFDKYPHGVSEQEWEKNRLPHRAENAKGSEAIMSQESELQSVEEFFASLAPPSKADDGIGKKRIGRKRGKSAYEDKHVYRGSKDHVSGDVGRKSSQGASQQSQPNNDLVQHRGSYGLAAHSMYPFSERAIPQHDLSTSDIDVPMTGVMSGLQSGQGNSAFDGASPAAMLASGGMEQNYLMSSTSGSSSNARAPPVATQANSPFDYVSPASSSNTGGINRSGSMSFNFNYTSAVPQLDRQMVFGGYTGMDSGANGSSNVLNNFNSVEYWGSPWESHVDMDSFTGFNDPSFGLNAGINMNNPNDEPRRPNTFPHFRGITSHGRINSNSNNNNTNNHSSSTAFFMPFNIEPPNAMQLGSGSNAAPFDDLTGLDSMTDMGSFAFSPGLSEQQQHQQHEGG